jgi:hypothetical protein
MAEEIVHGVHLKRTDERVDEVAALAAFCGGAVGVEGVLDDLDRRLHRSVPSGFRVWRAWTWDRHDAFTKRWWPQGISTSADATGSKSGKIAGHEVVTVSWYSKTVSGFGKGTRISFVDANARRYRHVLLVVPKVVDGRVTFETLHAHAGGIVWCGPYLYVAGTRKGLYVFRLEDLVRIPDEAFVEDHAAVGRSGERLASHGYRYVLPLRFTYRAAADEGHDPLRYSFLSLDRTAAGGPELVAGEYGRRKMSTQLARFGLDPDTWLLQCAGDGLSRPLQLDREGQRGMQGACVVHDTWYVTVSHGPWGLGTLYVGRPGQFRPLRRALPMGPEDITYVPQTDSLWSVSEHPGRRWIYKLRRPATPTDRATRAIS